MLWLWLNFKCKLYSQTLSTLSISQNNTLPHCLLHSLYIIYIVNLKEMQTRWNGEGEHEKVASRKKRRDSIEAIKKLQKDRLSEDISKDAEKEAQDLTDKYISLVEKHLEAKEKEIMAV